MSPVGGLVVDGEAVQEFLDKAEPLLEPPVQAALDAALHRRTDRVHREDIGWAARWALAPVSRRVSPAERLRWQPELEPIWALAAAGDGEGLLSRLAERPTAPDWLIDWATYWLNIYAPEWPWWGRWVYRREGGTGALPLVTGDLDGLRGAGLVEAYAAIRQDVRFLGSVLDSTRRLTAVSDEHRPLVALGAVYAVYMFTMAAWKLTEEFTRVFPPFPVVLQTLLGVRRWEAMERG